MNILDLRNTLVHNKSVNETLYELSNPQGSEVICVRWLAERSSRLYHDGVDDPIANQVQWELRDAPEVPAEVWGLDGKSFITSEEYPSFGLLVDQSKTVLRKLYCTDCYSELCYTDWYNDDNPLEEARLMPDGLDSEDEGFGETWLPGWENANTVYNWCPYEKRVQDDIRHTEGFLHHPKYTAVVVLGDDPLIWSFVQKYAETGLLVIRLAHKDLCADVYNAI